MAHLKATEYKYRLTMSESKIQSKQHNTHDVSLSLLKFFTKLMRKIKIKLMR